MINGTNVMLVCGYLTSDPQQRGENGKVATYSISVPAGKDKWDVIPVKAFGKEATKALFLKKGTEVAVVAHATQSSFTKQDGTRQTVNEHVIDKQFADIPGFEEIPHGFVLLSKAVEALGTRNE